MLQEIELRLCDRTVPLGRKTKLPKGPHAPRKSLMPARPQALPGPKKLLPLAWILGLSGGVLAVALLSVLLPGPRPKGMVRLDRP